MDDGRDEGVQGERGREREGGGEGKRESVCVSVCTQMSRYHTSY